MTIRTDWPKYAAASGTHEKVLSIIADMISQSANSQIRACDVPCGAGAFSQQLSERGVDVVAVDIAPADSFVYDPEKRVLHDCNQGLPFDNEKLDLVVSIEGIEHLENPTRFLRECSRVTKPGGLIILTTPNVDSFRSRKYAFFRGYHKYFGPGHGDQKDSGHLLPIDAMFVVNSIRAIGLELVMITSNRLSGKSWLKERLRKKLQEGLPDYMRNSSIFYGEVAIYVIRKSAPQTVAPVNSPNAER